ncbi:MAG: hypothetical protein ACE5RE_03330 [Candidatus Nitrosomaritimum aestuariumsis]
MRNDERFEIERAFDLLPHVVGSSWAVVWYRLNKIKKPSREEYRQKVLDYLKMMEPIFEVYPEEDTLTAMNKYLESRQKEEYEKIISGLNSEVEKRYDRYVDYG